MVERVNTSQHSSYSYIKLQHLSSQNVTMKVYWKAALNDKANLVLEANDDMRGKSNEIRDIKRLHLIWKIHSEMFGICNRTSEFMRNDFLIDF